MQCWVAPFVPHEDKLQSHAFESVIPTLPVSNLDLSLPFYRAFGFDVAWTHQLADTQPRLASITSGTIELFLTEHRVAPFGAVVYINTTGVDALNGAAIGAGLSPTFGPADREWGQREVYFTDPDGNVLRFGERLAQSE